MLSTSYINTGDLLSINNSPAVATGPSFTQLYYDLEAREMKRHGLDYGVARNVVPVLFTNTGRECIVELSCVRKISSATL